jgi:ankyrin repeat protein
VKPSVRSRNLALGSVAVVLGLAVGALVLRSHLAAGATAPARAQRALSEDSAGQYLRDAARAGDLELIQGLLAAGAPLESTDKKGYSALILAAYHGHADAVDALLAAGADACHPDARGNTAMMGAAFKGYEGIVARLSRERCAIDQSNASGKTALMFASLVGKTGIVQLLERRGADSERRDETGRTAEDWARTQDLSR